MAGPEFFQTRMGQRFYEVTAPRIAEELATLNKNLSSLVRLLRASLRTPEPEADGDGTQPE